jgi:hypothetical protein
MKVYSIEMLIILDENKPNPALTGLPSCLVPQMDAALCEAHSSDNKNL